MATMALTRRALLRGGAVAVAGLASGCGGDDLPAGATGVDKVTVLTGAGFQGREAPLFVARTKNWFADERLVVDVLPGKGTTENLKTLASGKATFATLDVSGAIIEFAKPNGIRDFTLTSVVHQRNLACFVALASGGISTPRDLAGRTLSYIPGGVNYVLFDTYAKLAGFDAGKVTWVSNPIATQHAALLAQRKVDAISQFVPAVESVKAVTGQDVTVLPFSDYMGDLYGSAIAVTPATARDKPDLVRRFNRAFHKGLSWALGNPEEAGQIYAAQKETQGQPPAAAVAEIKAMTGYVKGSADIPIGHFDLARVARNIAILQGAGTIHSGLTAIDIVAPDLVG